MKILLILAVFTLNLFSQDKKIEITDIDNKIKVYPINEIKNIKFEFKTPYVINVIGEDDKISNIEASNETVILFDNNVLNISDEDFIKQFQISTIKTIQFEKKTNHVPFGELVVDEILLNNLDNPWGLDFIDKDNIIFTEHDGYLFIYNIPNKTKTEVTGLPKVARVGQGGLLDITLHPDFNQNKYVYLSYAIEEGGKNTTAIGRGKLENNKLENFQELFRGYPLVNSSAHFGSRIVFDNDAKMYFSIGERGNGKNAQDSTNSYGCVLRLNDDGTIPADNPFLQVPKAAKEIYTKGNRNIQGLFYVPETNQVWSVEHGPRGGDELNIVKAGSNYGWPLVTFGINYDGTPITDKTTLPGYEDPITYWVPAPSRLRFRFQSSACLQWFTGPRIRGQIAFRVFSQTLTVAVPFLELCWLAKVLRAMCREGRGPMVGPRATRHGRVRAPQGRGLRRWVLFTTVYGNSECTVK